VQTSISLKGETMRHKLFPGLAVLFALAMLIVPALAAAAGGVEAEEYPASLEIAKEEGVYFDWSGVGSPLTRCSDSAISGTLTGPSSTMSGISGMECEVEGDGANHKLNWNGCRIELHPGSESSFDIGPPGCGPVTGLPIAHCGGAAVEILPQAGLPATYENIIAGGSREVRAKIHTNLEFNTLGPCKGEKLEFEAAWVIGATASSIWSVDGGFYISGRQSENESEQPRFVSEAKGPNLFGSMSAGGAVKVTTPGLGSIQCGSASFDGILPWSMSVIPGVYANIGNCAWNGEGATINMRSCYLSYGVSNLDYEPPTSYKGAVGVGCQTKGDAIQVEMSGCVMKIAPQYNPASSEVIYENQGEGTFRKVRIESSVANNLTYAYSSGFCVLLGKGGSNGSLSIGDTTLHAG
jgi:hypothetical protein